MESKPKPIFCIGVNLPFNDISEISKTPKVKKLEEEYHVLIYSSDSTSFQLFNSDNLEPSNLEEIKKYISEKCH